MSICYLYLCTLTHVGEYKCQRLIVSVFYNHFFIFLLLLLS